MDHTTQCTPKMRIGNLDGICACQETNDGLFGGKLESIYSPCRQCGARFAISLIPHKCLVGYNTPNAVNTETLKQAELATRKAYDAAIALARYTGNMALETELFRSSTRILNEFADTLSAIVEYQADTKGNDK